MEAISATVMMKALDGLSLRQTATAQNIANAGTPNYRPVQVTFEAALRNAALKGDVASMTPKIELQPASVLGADMRLDLETATAAATAGRYGAVVDILSRQLQLHSLALTGGR